MTLTLTTLWHWHCQGGLECNANAASHFPEIRRLGAGVQAQAFFAFHDNAAILCG